MSQAEAMFPTRAARRQKTADAGITNSLCSRWCSALFEAQGSASPPEAQACSALSLLLTLACPEYKLRKKVWCRAGSAPAEKHALALCGKDLVLAYPFDTPEWLFDLYLLFVHASLSITRAEACIDCIAGASPAEKHAVVLGLKAFVLAHPYDVPVWLPDLLLLLVRASFQPAPIKTSVRCSSCLVPEINSMP